MGKFQDLIGKTFGRWTVLSKSDVKTKDGALQWNCVCECGATGLVSGHNLRSGISSSCGCYKREKSSCALRKDEVGSRYGNFTVASFSHINSDRKAVWRCECDCGNIELVKGKDLRNGSRVRCKQCSKKYISDIHVKDISNQRFGKLLAIKRIDKIGKSIWNCVCDCGNEIEISYNSLVNGFSTSCGCEKQRITQDKIDNISGKKFGSLTALFPTGEKVRNIRIWHCRCECGSEIDVQEYGLIKSKTISCGCTLRKDLTGKKFGRLTPLYVLDERRGIKVVWHCKCDCGNEKNITSGDLLSGKTISCGCYNSEKARQKRFVDMVGERYGKLLVVSLSEKVDKYNRRYWNCICDCGLSKVAREGSLRSGALISCGCVKSKAEMIFKKILIKNNIEFIPQKTFDGCVYEGQLRYDFYIVEMNLCVELDGGQHKHPVKKFGAEEGFRKTKIRDKIKNDYCAEHGIELLRVDDTNFNRLEEICKENKII